MKQNIRSILVILVFAVTFFIYGCSARAPVLYPNSYMKSAGEEKVVDDIDECRSSADEYVKSDAGRDAVKRTAKGGAGGAVIGGVAGAVSGDLVRGAGVGAAAGAASGLVYSLFKGAEPSPVYKSFVEKCLREKGYDVIGWE